MPLLKGDGCLIFRVAMGMLKQQAINLIFFLHYNAFDDMLWSLPVFTQWADKIFVNLHFMWNLKNNWFHFKLNQIELRFFVLYYLVSIFDIWTFFHWTSSCHRSGRCCWLVTKSQFMVLNAFFLFIRINLL